MKFLVNSIASDVIDEVDTLRFCDPLNRRDKFLSPAAELSQQILLNQSSER